MFISRLLSFNNFFFWQHIKLAAILLKEIVQDQLWLIAPECVEVYLGLNLDFKSEKLNLLRPLQYLPSF